MDIQALKILTGHIEKFKKLKISSNTEDALETYQMNVEKVIGLTYSNHFFSTACYILTLNFTIISPTEEILEGGGILESADDRSVRRSVWRS